MKEALTIYKLIILYMLNKVNSPLTLGLVSDYIIDKGYTNYFNVQNAFAELFDAELITASQTYNTSHYRITESGQQTLELFQNQLSHEIRAEIEQYLKENKQIIANRMNVISDYTLGENGEYLVTCSLIENGSLLFESKISIPSEEDAIKICDNWRANSNKLYSLTIATLLQTPEA